MWFRRGFVDNHNILYKKYNNVNVFFIMTMIDIIIFSTMTFRAFSLQRTREAGHCIHYAFCDRWDSSHPVRLGFLGFHFQTFLFLIILIIKA